MKKIYSLLFLIALTAVGNAQIIQTYPHFEDFESFNTCGTVCGNACSLPLTSFWINIPFGDDMDWTVDENGTPSGNTGPETDHNPGTNNGNYLYTEASGSCNNNEAWLATPLLDLSQLQAPTMDFWFHMLGGNMGTIHVDVSLDSGSTWSNDIVPAWTGNVNLWQQRIIKLNPYAGDTIMLRIRGMTGNGFTSDMAIDDFRFYELPPVDLGVVALPGPFSGCGLTTDSIRITIHNFGGLDFLPGDTVYAAYQIGTQPSNQQAFILTDTLFACGGELDFVFATIANFSMIGQYDLVTWTEQPGEGDPTNDTLRTVVQNFAIHNTFPYFDNMESGSGEWQNDGTNNTWSFGTPIKNTIIGAASGSNAWVTGGLGIGDYLSNEASWVENINCFDFTNETDLWVAASIWWNCEYSWDGAQLQYSANGGQTWNTLGQAFDPNNWYNDNTILGILNAGYGQIGWTGVPGNNSSGGWLSAKYDLSFLMGQSDIRFRFFFGSDGSVTDDGFAFDNFAIGPLPPQPDLGPDIDSCDIAITLDGSIGPGFYTWEHGPTGPQLVVDTTGQYILNYTDTLGFCSSDTIDVILRNTFYPDLGADTLLCAGDSVILDAGSDPNITSYRWSTLALSQTIQVNTGGIYEVTVTTNDGCMKSDTIQVTAVSTPTVSLGPDTLICDDAYILDAGIPGANYVWNTTDTTQFIAINSSGIYWVDLSACGTTVSDTVQITLNGIPAIDIGSDSSGCGSLVLDAGTWATYVWAPSGNTTQWDTITQTSTVSCTVTDSAGCMNTDTSLITILPLPTPQLTPSDTTICVGDSICLRLSPPAISNTYLWSTGSTTDSICLATAGQYWVICTDSNGCQGRDSTSISTLSVPSVTFTVDTSNCPDIVFNATNNGGAVASWAWNLGDNNSGNGDTLMHTYMSNDTYTVVLTATNQCGSDTHTEQVGINCLDGIDGPLNSGSVKVFPNPNNGAFQIRFQGLAGEEAAIRIVDLLGRILWSQESGILTHDQTLPISVTELAQGSYWIHIQAGESRWVTRMIRQ